MKKKSVMLSMLCLVLIISLLAPIKHVNAEDDIEEYVIMTIDKETLKKVIKLKGIKQKDELINSEFLEDSNTAVVKMGEKKAKALSQKEKVLFVERNFLFFGQESMEDNEPENTMAETEYPFVEGSEKFNETEDETFLIDISEDEIESSSQETDIDEPIKKKMMDEGMNENEEEKDEGSNEDTVSENEKEKTESEENSGESDANKEGNTPFTEEESEIVKEEKALIDAIDRQNTDLTKLQWNLEAIHWNENQLQGVIPLKIAILDSGINFDDDIEVISDIRIIADENEVNPLFIDGSGHGSGIAGLIAAKHNNIGITGINPRSKIYSIKVLDDKNQGTLASVVAGIYEAINNECQIISMSFGTYRNSEILHEAIRDAYKAGILMIAAAGNEKGDIMYPAAYPEVMAVGASDSYGKQINLSSGEEMEILAPGEKILVTSLFGGGETVKGTSLSTAQVTAAASLVWGKHPHRSADFIRKLLVNTAQRSNEWGNNEVGILDIENALRRESIFASYYQKDEEDYPQMEHKVRNAGIFNTSELVEGLWGNSGHQGNVTYSETTYNDDSNPNKSKYPVKKLGIDCIRLTIKLADSKTKDANGNEVPSVYKKAAMIHGAGNYLAGLRFLYSCAYLLKQKNQITVDSNTAIKAILDTAAGYTHWVLPINENGEAYHERLYKATKELLKVDLKIGEGKSGEIQGYKVMGFALHLIGDLNAHRVMVPWGCVKDFDTGNELKYFPNTLSSTNPSTAHIKHDREWLKPRLKNSTLYRYGSEEQEGGNLCGNLNCFYRAVQEQLVEFRDISKFGTAPGSAFEDNNNFYEVRYSNSNYIAKRIFTFFMMEMEPIPTPGKKHVNVIGVVKPSQSGIIYNGYRKYANDFPEEKTGDYASPSFFDNISTDEIR